MIYMVKVKEASGTGVLDTSHKLNCWEHKKCGRQPGGSKVAELGVCPVTIYGELDGAHGGKNAGRSCWAIAGSLCGGKIQGTYAQKLNNCWRCDFMNAVKRAEEPTTYGFSATRLGMERSLEKQKSAGGGTAHASKKEEERH
jgi:hypothetical protein